MKQYRLTILFVWVMNYVYAQDSTSPAAMHLMEVNLKTYPLLWQQTAAEYRALCYQAFNIAALRLNEIPKNKLKKQKLAIITDLDETILDNSYSEAQLIKEGKEHSNQAWKDWTGRSVATAVPGAIEFLQMAKQKGITIFYISNRDTGDVASTLINLKKLQLPDADTSHMLFLSNTSSKEIRRQIVMSRYNVVMLLGDNLNDFMQAFEGKKISDRFAETDKVKNEWGKKFIVLPNATYGEWENAVYDYDRKLNATEKEAKRKSKLTGYK
ncbi:MAG TPA: 5'-nucleotidase, lipoprotein e(P4) family [Chitinophagaceae bacterium]|nr:5'-nucleotidase, lipoprotein e(P4) family [Chitinophagaceae bacterium]